MSDRIGLRVGPEHVGARVVLRRRAPGGRYVDLLGELLSWADGVARVRTRTGEATVAIDQVIAGRPVPPPPARRGPPHLALTLEAQEDVAGDGWRPLEQAWIGVPGHSWRLRAAGGFTARANSVLAVGEPGTSVPQAIQAAEAWYAERGLPCMFAVPWVLDAPELPDGARDTELDAELRRRGYALDCPTLMCTAATRVVAGAALRPGVVPLAGGLRLDLADEPDQAWADIYRYRGQPLPAAGRRVLLSAPAQVFVSVRDGTHTVAVARGASSRGWTGVTAMLVSESHRRQGLGLQVLGAIAGWALERGDRSAYLQVADANPPARALYASAGFVPHHGYHYRLLPRAGGA